MVSQPEQPPVDLTRWPGALGLAEHMARVTNARIVTAYDECAVLVLGVLVLAAHVRGLGMQALTQWTQPGALAFAPTVEALEMARERIPPKAAEAMELMATLPPPEHAEVMDMVRDIVAFYDLRTLGRPT